MITLLLYIGLIRRNNDDSIRWPIWIAPAYVWKNKKEIADRVRFWGFAYMFRNPRGVIKWEEGRLLPRRWGFGIGGLIEIGDRG